MLKRICMFSLICGTSSPVLAEVTIDQMAPADSIFVAGVNNASVSFDRFKRTPGWGLWQSPELKTIRADAMEAIKQHMEEIFEELGVDEESLPWPKGAMGVAIFPITDEEVMETRMGFLGFLDYGENAASADRLIRAALEKGEESGELEFEREQENGRTYYLLDLTHGDLVDAPLEAMDLPIPGEMMGDMSELHYVRDGSRFVFSSDREQLDVAIEVATGEDGPGFDGLEIFQGVQRQLGRSDAWAVLRVDELLRAMAAGNPMAMMAQAMFATIVGDLRAVGFGMRLDTGSAMVEQTIAVYMPNGKNGLSAMVDVEANNRDVPSFVGPDAAGYSVMHFRFDEVMNFLQAVGQANPMIGQTLNQLLAEYGETIEKVCSAIGPQVHKISVMERPLAADSMKSLVAIRSEKPEQVEEVFAQYAPNMGEPRDFLGHRIYSLPFNPMAMMGGGMGAGPDDGGFSFGFGGGYVMIGETSMVEDALRSINRGGGSTLFDDPEYRRALRTMADDGVVSWGVMRLHDYFEYFLNLEGHFEQQMIEDARQWNPEMAKELELELAGKDKRPWADLDADLLSKYFGSAAWSVRSRADGYVVKYFLIEPGGD